MLCISRLTPQRMFAERVRRDHGPQSYSVRLCRNTVSEHRMPSHVVEPGRERCNQYPPAVFGVDCPSTEAIGVCPCNSLVWFSCMYDHGATRSLCLHAMGWYSSRYQVLLTITFSRYDSFRLLQLQSVLPTGQRRQHLTDKAELLTPPLAQVICGLPPGVLGAIAVNDICFSKQRSPLEAACDRICSKW